MPDPDQNSSDDDLYAWFIAGLSTDMEAREVRDGVIDVVVRFPGLDFADRRVELMLTRSELREAARLEGDIVDDRETGVPAAVNPVLAGLRMLLIYADEALGTLRKGEDFVVLHDGQFWGSTTPTSPPMRGPLEKLAGDDESGGWFVITSREPGDE